MISKQQFLVGLLGWSHSALALPKVASSPSVSLAGPSLVNHPTSEPHTPYSGTPTTTGAVVASSVGLPSPARASRQVRRTTPAMASCTARSLRLSFLLEVSGPVERHLCTTQRVTLTSSRWYVFLYLLWKTVSNCSGFGCLPRIHRTRPLPRRTCSILCRRLRKGRSHR